MRHVWTTADHRFIRENYLSMTDKELATHIGTGPRQLRDVRLSLGCKRPRSFAGLHAGWAKNLERKGKPYWTNEKGKPVKRITVYRDGRGITMNYCRYVWEKYNGPVPAGMYVTTKDGNRMRTRIDNLILVTKAELSSLAQGRASAEKRSEAVRKGHAARRRKRAAEIYLTHKPYEFGKV